MSEIDIGETIKNNIDCWSKLYYEELGRNAELEHLLYAMQSRIDELTQNEEQLKIELGKEKEKNKELQNNNMFNLYEMGKKNARERIELDYISKDKIKEKIELLKKKLDAEKGIKTINYHLYNILIEEFSNLLEEK